MTFLRSFLFFQLLIAISSSSLEEVPINNTISQTSTADTNNTFNKEEYSELDKLSNSELETICTTRGFEVIKETAEDGKEVEYTREDYLEAAAQCLAIEAEMEKVIQENPHMLDELKEEAEKMTKEKEKLEAELAKHESELSRATGDDTKGIPFVVNDGEINDTETNSKDPQQDDIVDLDKTETNSEEKKETSISNEESNNSSEKFVTDINPTNFTTTDIFMEIKEQIIRDFSFIIKTILPKEIRDPMKQVLTPFVMITKSIATTAFTMMRKYAVIILGSAKEEVQQPLQQQS